MTNPSSVVEKKKKKEFTMTMMMMIVLKANKKKKNKINKFGTKHPILKLQKRRQKKEKNPVMMNP